MSIAIDDSKYKLTKEKSTDDTFHVIVHKQAQKVCYFTSLITNVISWTEMKSGI